jgi:2-amino-4-hydroxy-6-hydroxymethyldihydropteridine diphosphokinase
LNNIFIGLGSNLGDRVAVIQAAVSRIAAVEGVRLDNATGLAPLYETSPVQSSQNSPSFLNTVIRIDTTLTPRGLLDACQQIESDLGRVRREHGEPRIIDIDILLFGSLVINEPKLTIPHPRLHERRFVLEPLADIAPDLVHPILSETIAQLAERAREAYPHDCVERVGVLPRDSETTGIAR